jgi:hypothetical protein
VQKIQGKDSNVGDIPQEQPFSFICLGFIYWGYRSILMSYRVGKVNLVITFLKERVPFTLFISSIFLSLQAWTISTRLNVGTQIVHSY